MGGTAKKVIVIRWLRCYGNQWVKLSEAIRWEMKNSHHWLKRSGRYREVAAEHIHLKGGKALRSTYLGNRSGVGLVVEPRAVRRLYDTDVWSSVGRLTVRGRLLFPGQQPLEADDSYPYGEAFCKPVYKAIVVVGRLSNQDWKDVQWASKFYGLPIIRLKGGD